MSTFLTDPGAIKENQQMHSQVLYAPFLKPTDKVKQDVGEVSFSDFHPKRFALSYDPPIISKRIHILILPSPGIYGALIGQALSP